MLLLGKKKSWMTNAQKYILGSQLMVYHFFIHAIYLLLLSMSTNFEIFNLCITLLCLDRGVSCLMQPIWETQADSKRVKSYILKHYSR